MKKQLKSISVVIPCYNEEDVLQNSMEELIPLLDRWKDQIISDYQIVFTNNGSSDNTLKEMLKIKEKYKKVKILDLRNNYGYQCSITAGLYNSDCELIVSIDSDLQDDPSKIEDMVNLHYNGFDLVLGIRDDRKTDNFFKRIFSECFYNLMSLLGTKTVRNHGDFRLMTKELVEDLKHYPEQNRFLRGLILKLDNKWASVYYPRRKRKFGTTKFKPINLISLALDGITSFSIKPIRFILIMGIIMFFISMCLIIYILYMTFVTGGTVKGWASTLLIILFFSGIQNIILGIIGEYIAKIYIETKNRPLFIIRKIY